MREITHIVLHSVAPATKSGKPYIADPTAADIRAYHVKEKGWSDIGYHFVVHRDGKIELGRPVAKPGAHVEGFNSHSIGIVFGGHGDIEDFTPEQKAAGVELIVDTLEEHGLMATFIKNPMRVLGHRECYQLPHVPNTHKTCPGSRVDMSEIRKRCLAEAHRRGHV